MKEDFTTRAILVSSIVDYLIHECEQFSIAYDISVYQRKNIVTLV